MMVDDKLTELYNSAQFLEKYGKDIRESYMAVFDKMDDTNLAARRLEWCMKYSKTPREIAIPSLEKFLRHKREDGFDKSGMTLKAELQHILLNTRLINERDNIPPDPIEEITQ